MEQPGAQQLFFQHIKNNLPSHLSLVDEIAALLNISNDSAYRRIRGEKGISFDEIRTLSVHFKISLDQLFYLNSQSIIFTGKSVDNRDFPFDLYLADMHGQLKFMNSFDKKELIYLCKDVPIFHYFHYSELAAFKFFFWMKTLLQYPSFGKKMFVSDDFADALHKTSGKIVEEYNKLPSQEVWNVENIHSTIRQIEYYKETKTFASALDIVNLYNCLDKTIDHIEKQAELGYKFSILEKQPASRVEYKLFMNEFVLGDNSLCAILNDTKVVYLNYGVLSYIITRDSTFTEHIYQHYQNIIRRSTLISNVGEKERSRFFNTMREKIHNRRRAINH